MLRGDGPPDASTLGVSALNVGMPEEHSFLKKQDKKVADLADIIEQWFDDMPGPAVVGLNEIAPGIANKLVAALEPACVCLFVPSPRRPRGERVLIRSPDRPYLAFAGT